MKLDEWIKQGVKLYGSDTKLWCFVCPICNTRQSIQDYLNAGIDEDKARESIAISCIGRELENPQIAIGRNTPVKKGKPCNYAGYGLFRLNPINVEIENGEDVRVFAFAESLIDS